jgi:acetyl esterase/lipase
LTSPTAHTDGEYFSMLVILRDQGLPMPAGAVLISPWVDLTHSFPSVSGDNNKDYIPQHGFVHRPSAAWPPPNADDLGPILEGAIGKKAVETMGRKSSQHQRQEAIQDAIRGFSIDQHPRDIDPQGNVNNPAGSEGVKERPGNTIPGIGHDLSIMINGSLITIKDQIQMYTTNQLISHPLVSPILQPSLGGLPPLLILTGGGEMLRDEQIYLAHKAADPTRYPPGEAYLTTPEDHAAVTKWKPTHVQLQVWDDLCHVAPTLSFTRPAKHMYRSIAKFCATVLAAAQTANIDYEDDDLVSLISTDTESVATSEGAEKAEKDQGAGAPKIVPRESCERRRRAGDDLPALSKYMIRERVDRNGNVRELEPPSALPALQISLNEIGVIKPGIVGKWLETKQKWDTKYAREKRRIQKQRVKEIAKGYQDYEEDDAPPPSALAGRRGLGATKEVKKQKGWGLGWWSKWASSHDEKTIERTEEMRKSGVPATTVVKGAHRGTSTEPGLSTAFPYPPGNKQKQREQTGAANSFPSDTTSTDSAASFAERRAKYLAAINKAHARDPGPYIRLPPSPDFTFHEGTKKITISCNEESYDPPSNTQEDPTNQPNPAFPPWPSNERRDVATFDQVAVETLDPIDLGESCGGSVLTTIDSRPAHVGRLDENASANQRGKQPVNYAIRLPRGDLEPPSEEAETPAPDLEDPLLHLPVPITELVTLEDPEGQIVRARCLGSEVLEFVDTDQLPSEVRRAMGIESGSDSGVGHTTILSGDSQPVR